MRPRSVAEFGSPPQVRGKPDDRTVIVGTNGITPAGAGKTYVKYDLRQAAPDHPRRCGENCHVPVRFLRTVGSPPQVRGKLLIYAQIGRLRGITPAGAGKTSSRLSHTSLPQDHPRRCGENVYVFPCVRNKPGSPPQVRGKLCL